MTTHVAIWMVTHVAIWMVTHVAIWMVTHVAIWMVMNVSTRRADGERHTPASGFTENQETTTMSWSPPMEQSRSTPWSPDGASIAPFVPTYTASHRLAPSFHSMSLDLVTRPVIIGRGAYARVGSALLHGVTFGDGAGVGAGSVATFDVEPNVLVPGNPTVFVRPLSVDDT